MSRYQQGPPPGRQQQGQGGNAQVSTNCFKVTRLPTKTFTMYDVSFKPEISKDSWKKRAELVHHLRVLVTPQPFAPLFLYDGGAIGYAHPDVSAQLGSFQSFRVRLRDMAVPPADARNVTVIEFKRTAGAPITSTEINEVVIQGQDSPRRSSLLNFMQLVVRDSFNNIHANNGKAYFPLDPELRRDIPDSWLELRKGIFHSVRPAIGNVIIVVDTTVAAFWKKGRLQDIMLFVLNKRNLKDLEKLSRRELDTAKKAFRGVFVREKKGDPPRVGGKRSIKGFEPEGALYQFENGDGMLITIKEHYSRLHNIELQHWRLPGVILRDTPGRKEIVPMETCFIEENQLYKKDLPPKATQEMVKYSTLKPVEKLRAISKAAGKYAESNALNHAQMQVTNEPLKVDATLITPPRIMYGEQGHVNVERGAWNLLGKKFLHTPRRCHWAVLNLAPGRFGRQQVDQLVKTFTQCAQNLGLPLGPPQDPVVTQDPNGGHDRLVEALNGIMKSVRGTLGEENFKLMLEARAFFIFCILDQEAAGPRATIKNWGDVKNGVVTQCVRVNKLSFRDHRQASQYYNNVALKVNARLGGVNSVVQGSQVYQHLTAEKGPLTMIVGADVSHPSPGVRKPSVTSLVYNHDRRAVQYTAITRVQDPRQEVIQDLKEMMKIAVKDFMPKMMGPVANIVFFRDGVSEGEYGKIKDAEIGAINEAIAEVWSEVPNIVAAANAGNPIPKPKLSFVVVGKRHHTLMFPASHAVDDQKTGNCKAGVVVNSGITQPTIRDFFLLSHSAIIGTSRSSHYIILQDEVFGGQSTDPLQELAFALCHSYAKATRSVSIPAPVYYADLACGRDAFHFDPVRLESLRASDFGSVASADAPFDLGAWKAAYEDYHARTRRQMNFL